VTLGQLAAAMTESVLPTLSGMTKSCTAVVGSSAKPTASSSSPRQRASAGSRRTDVEVSVHLTNGGEGSSSAPSSSGTPAPTPVVAADTDQDERDHIDVSDLEDATDVSTSGVDKLVQAFPGAELIEQETP
jgi:hypothetical protein